MFALAPPHLFAARLAAKDRAAALSSVRAMIGRLGGTELVVRLDERAAIVDGEIPRDAAAAFLGELRQLGTVTVEHRPATSATTIGVSIHITD